VVNAWDERRAVAHSKLMDGMFFMVDIVRFEVMLDDEGSFMVWFAAALWLQQVLQ
jgi:hypothetical protein